MITAGLVQLSINGKVYALEGHVEIQIDQLKFEELDNISGKTLQKQTGTRGGRIKGSNIFLESSLEEWNDITSQTNLSVQLVVQHSDAYYEYSMANAMHLGDRLMNTEKNTVAFDFSSDQKVGVARTAKPSN